jgi:hypothetical protein
MHGWCATAIVCPLSHRILLHHSTMGMYRRMVLELGAKLQPQPVLFYQSKYVITLLVLDIIRILTTNKAGRRARVPTRGCRLRQPRSRAQASTSRHPRPTHTHIIFMNLESCAL